MNRLSLFFTATIFKKFKGADVASNQRATQEKRRRGREKQQTRLAKAENRILKKEQKKIRDETTEPGVDPDLVGIYPGPQPGQVI